MPLFIMLLTGCDEIDNLFAGITDPDLAEGLVLGVKAPENLDLSDTNYASGGRVGAYLSNLNDGVVTADDATVSFTSSSNGEMALEDYGDGKWATHFGDPVTYNVGESFSIERDGSEILRADAAEAADFTLPDTVGAYSGLTVDLAGQDYDAVLVTVIDLASGTETFTNTPLDSDAVIGMVLNHPSLDAEIPGDAFPLAGNYAVGVAGLRSNKAADVTDVNTIASAMVSGMLSFRTIEVTGE